MERVFFEEKQKLPEVVVWMFAVVGLALCFPFLRGLYMRMVLGQRWGDDSLTNVQIVYIVCGIALVAGLVTWLVAVQYYEIKIDATGIYFRSYPQQQKEQKIERELIIDYTIRKLKWYEFIRGRQKRKVGWMGETDLYVMRGNTALVLTLSGGKKLILGTQNPDGLLWAMKKLLTNS